MHGEGGPGDLETVLARPANLAEYGEADVYELAAALAEALVPGAIGRAEFARWLRGGDLPG